jgi:hypothetical protein
MGRSFVQQSFGHSEARRHGAKTLAGSADGKILAAKPDCQLSHKEVTTIREVISPRQTLL